MKPAFARTLLAALLSVATAASAQTPDPQLIATRRGLIDSAREARAAGDHARALDLARRAGQIEMSPSLRRFIAESQETLGRYADAMSSAELCVREGTGPNQSHGAACREVLARVAPRVGRLVVEIQSPAPQGLHIRVGEVDIPEALWGAPVVVTPGSVAVEASAPTHRPFRAEVAVRAGATERLTVTLEALPPEPVPVTPPVVAPAPTPVVAPTPTPAPPPASGGPGAGPFVLMGVGAVGLGLAVTFLVLRSDAENAGCPDNPADACPDYDAADRYATLAWTSLGVGIAGAAAGLTWFLVAQGSRNAQRATITGGPLRGGAQLGLRLAF